MSVESLCASIKRKILKIIVKKGLYDLYYLFSQDIYGKLYPEDTTKKKIFLLMEPEYGNVGDQAIAYATEKYISDYFSEYYLIKVTEENTYKHMKTIQRVCAANDIIFLQGGGNMGSLYPQIERLRRFCIKCFPNNKIVSMPTTATYRDNMFGKREFKESLKIYNAHKKLILLAREKYTYDFLKENYINARCLLVPDIVFYLINKIEIRESERNCVMLCIRKEMESVLSRKSRNEIIRGVINRFPDGFLYDTEIKRTVDPDIRDLEVMSMIRQFNRTKIVITDRMHGMIFAAVTRTPCVVLKSLDKKIEGTYQWLKEFNSIKFIESNSFEEVNEAISLMENSIKGEQVKFEHDYWKEIRDLIIG